MAGKGSGGGGRGQGKRDEGEPSVSTNHRCSAENVTILMNTHILVKRRPERKNVGTSWSLSERKKYIGETGSWEWVVPGKIMMGKKRRTVAATM